MKFRDDLYNFAVGFAMGGANVIPGVSGGTMLFIMGAFGKLIDALRDIASPETFKLLFRGDFRGLVQRIQWRFLLGVGLGVLVSFATLAKLIVWLLQNYPSVTNGFFLGLIVASIFTVRRQIHRCTWPIWVSGLLSAAAAYGIISLVPMHLSSSWYILLGCGAVCIIAMILPGLSGSFLLLIFGQYETVWNAVGNVAHGKIIGSELAMLCWLAAGCVTGLAAFVHLLKLLMDRFADLTIAALIGFMVGSLPKIWPFQHDDPTSLAWQKGKLVATRSCFDWPSLNLQLLWVLLAFAAGLALVFLIEYLAGKRRDAVEG